MKVISCALIGAILGTLVGFMNRPTYFGGLYKPSVDEIASSERLVGDTVAVLATYGLIGLAIGLVVGAALTAATRKG